MRKLRKIIQGYLKPTYKLYFQNPPKDAIYPYIVYDIAPVLNDGESKKVATVDFNGYDMPSDGDISTLEILMENFNASLNKKVLTADDMTAVFFLDRQLYPQEDDKRIKRMYLSYQVELFERS